MKTFVEIGCSDFNNLENFLDYGWRGFFVEPVPKYFNSLFTKVKNKPNCVCVEAAITDKDGNVRMDVLEPFEEEQWQRGISHIHVEGNYSNIASNLVNRNRNVGNVTTINVPCMTLDSFLNNFKITDIDFLQLDVEGHELVILENYSWKVKPKMLKIEHKFIDDKRLTSLLNKNNYKWWLEKDDLYGILMS